MENKKSMLWMITDGMSSENGIEHKEIWVLYVVENGGRVSNVSNGRGEKFACGERNAVESGLEHVAMDLRDVGDLLGRF